MQLKTRFSESHLVQQHRIVAAKLLLESVCKHILDDLGVLYERNLHFGRLFSLAAACLSLGADSRQQQLVRRILELSRPAAVLTPVRQQQNSFSAGPRALKSWLLSGLAMQQSLVKEAGSLANYMLKKHLESRLAA